MSDQPTQTNPPPPTQSLDDILNQLERATGSTPSVSTPPAPTAPETPPVPIEAAPVMPQEPPAAPVDPAPMAEVSSAPLMTPPPVATLPEKEIPVPPPIVPSEPAPMVQEAPSLEPSGAPTPVQVETPAPEPIAPPITPEPIATIPSPEPMIPAPAPVTPMPEVPPASPSAPTVETPVEEPPRKSNAGKIIAGVIGVLLLIGAVGAGVFLTQQSQENRSPAFAPSTPIPTPITLAATPIPTAAPTPRPDKTAIMSGTVCNIPDNKTPGNILFYNTTDKFLVLEPYPSGGGNFKESLPPGSYLVMYQPNDTLTFEGYTSADHQLKAVALADKANVTGIQLCDTQMAKSSIPTKYAIY